MNHPLESGGMADREHVAERAAIMHHDGELPVHVAEWIAILWCSPPPMGITHADWRDWLEVATRMMDGWNKSAQHQGFTLLAVGKNEVYDIARGRVWSREDAAAILLRKKLSSEPLEQKTA
ncbi:MAG: hypothetical protein HQL74_07475 [Magnetococcales bacterium]|nr:hypothetical protein [Magnetococcales bacterium]